MSLDYRNCINFALPYLPTNSIVIDVGCNIDPIVEMNYAEWIENWNDDFTFLVLKSLPKAKCIGIEPLHWKSYEKKWKNDPRVDLLKIGLSDRNCFETIFFPGVHHVISSFYKQESFNQYDVKTKEVECKTLDALSYELNLEHIDYLKIDTEGAEYKILSGSTTLLEEKRISFIQFEYGLSDNTIPSVELICNLLSKYGYREVLTSGREKLWVNEQIYKTICMKTNKIYMKTNNKISLICACKNRNEPLQIALTSWLLKKEITEIIIVDWSSDESLSSLTKLDSRIKVITVQDQKYFNQPQPLNLAASIATGDYILKVDCDYVFSPYYNFFDTYSIDENSFLSGNHSLSKTYEYFDGEKYTINKNSMSLGEIREYLNSYNPIFKYLTGLLFVSRHNFIKIGGYNENLGKYYAYEDNDIFHRLRVLGLTEKKLDFNYDVLHIPHPDTKRIENFEGYNPLHINELMYNMGGNTEEERKWNAEYLLTQKHIEENKKIALLTNEYYVRPQTQWNVQQIDDQNYYANKVMNNKLENFPSVYYVSLEESKDRQENLERQFAEYGITPTAILSKRYSESDDEITGKFLDQMNGGTIGCVVSHLKAIRKWYEETDEDYAFFCEDDLSLETVQYWDFTWEEFIETIPEDACRVQLLIIQENFETFDIHKRLWNDWAGTAYIITRNYAKTLVENYCLGEKRFHLELPGSRNVLIPLLENVLFETLEDVCYSVPLFVEDVRFSTTFSPEEDNEVVNNQKRGHYEARETVLNYWKNKNKSFTIVKKEEPQDFTMNQIECLLSEYVNDSENAENNFKLGVWYWNQSHSAPALSYFLRCAERAEDPTLAYEALLWSHLCYETQGTRDMTARTLLQHAIHELPNRPEAYYLLAKFHSKREQWTDAYMAATQGLTLTEKDLPPLRNDIGYVGEYTLLYEKAVSGWWWGKNIESGLIFKDLHENYRMQEEYHNKVLDNLQKHFPNLLVPPNFDWGNTDPEYVEMFSKENFIERTYEKHCQVKLGDVVVDAGANCGSFTYSILGKKPKKIYCIEPSNTIIHSLKKNVGHGPVTFINRAISDFESDSVVIADRGVYIYGNDGNEYPTTTFKKIIERNNITRIDFLKFDCEGGEYSIFTKENYDFIINNVGHCAGEWHINDHKDAIERFIEFRDLYLNKCNLLRVYERSGKEITEQIFDNNYLYGFREYWKHTYLGQFIIYFTFNN